MTDGWIDASLGEIADIRIGRTPPRNDPRFWTDDLARPFCSIADMVGSDIRPVREGVTELAEREGKAKRVPKGSLLLSFKLTIGRVGFAAVDLFPNEAIAWIIPRGAEVEPRYLALWLGHADLRGGSGRAVKGDTLNSESLRAISVRVPPLAEQRRIIDLMAAVDDAEAAARRLAGRTRTFYQRLAAEAFVRFTLDTAELGAVVDVKMGRQRAPRYAQGDHMLPYLRAANVKDGRLELDSVLLMEFGSSDAAAYALRAGDVLVTEGCGSLAQLGASARWSEELAGTVCFQNTLIRLRALPNVTDQGYVHHLARHAHAAGWWAQIASGTNIFHIGATRAERLPVPVPDIDQQASVAQTLDAVDATMAAVTCEAETIERLRTALLDDLLAGEHEISTSHDRFLTVRRD
ncbi:MAG: restriction endonuclease subunit S [Candidatus Limnocylindrales bacterium]